MLSPWWHGNLIMAEMRNKCESDSENGLWEAMELWVLGLVKRSRRLGTCQLALPLLLTALLHTIHLASLWNSIPWNHHTSETQYTNFSCLKLSGYFFFAATQSNRQHFLSLWGWMTVHCLDEDLELTQWVPRIKYWDIWGVQHVL